MINKKIILSGIIGLTLILFVLFFSDFGESYTQNKINENIQIKTSYNTNEFLSDEKAELKKLVIDYLQLAIEGEFKELKKLVVKLSDLQNSRKKDNTKKIVNKTESPDLLPISEFLYEFATEETPNVIYKGQWKLHKIQIISIEQDKAKLKVVLKKDDDGLQFVNQDFYLIKDTKNEWKIFEVKYTMR